MEGLGVVDRQFWKGKRVLVTGHTGFKGAWLALWLEKLGASVTGFSIGIPTEPSLYGALGEGSGVAATELAQKMADYGVATIIFTDISRDGMLSGVNAEATAALARACGVPIIASGGVASLDDIRNVKKYEKDGVAGCIIGKAIYTGAVNLPDALKIAAAKEE